MFDDFARFLLESKLKFPIKPATHQPLNHPNNNHSSLELAKQVYRRINLVDTAQ